MMGEGCPKLRSRTSTCRGGLTQREVRGVRLRVGQRAEEDWWGWGTGSRSLKLCPFMSGCELSHPEPQFHLRGASGSSGGGGGGAGVWLCPRGVCVSEDVHTRGCVCVCTSAVGAVPGVPPTWTCFPLPPLAFGSLWAQGGGCRAADSWVSAMTRELGQGPGTRVSSKTGGQGTSALPCLQTTALVPGRRGWHSQCLSQTRGMGW